MKEIDFPWKAGKEYEITVKAEGKRICADIGGQIQICVEDDEKSYLTDASVFLCREEVI